MASVGRDYLPLFAEFVASYCWGRGGWWGVFVCQVKLAVLTLTFDIEAFFHHGRFTSCLPQGIGLPFIGRVHLLSVSSDVSQPLTVRTPLTFMSHRTHVSMYLPMPSLPFHFKVVCIVTHYA